MRRRPLLSLKLLTLYGAYGTAIGLNAAWALQTVPWYWALTAGVGGWVFWTFVEYSLHRWAFHERPGGPLAKKYGIHWGHHEDPHAPEPFVITVWYTLPFAVLFWGLFWILAGGNPWAGATYAGFGIGYLSYETLHYLMHAQPVAPLPLLRKLWRHPYLHHYKAPERFYGVTVRWWDYIFGTA